MGARVTVVTGPARAGKTERLLARYRAALAAKQGLPRRVLWIAPTQRAAAELRDRLLGPELPACFSPGVSTFDRFAEAILQASPTPIRPISMQIKRQLLRRLLDAHHEKGKLRHFRAIAATEGMVDLVSRFISELKRAEVWPEDLKAACETRGMTAKDRELVRLYDEYQDTLHKHQLYDKEGRYWSARELLRHGQTEPYEHLEFVVIDGFSDFTRTQHEILQILAQRGAELQLTLPLEEPPRREDLFARSIETLGRLQENFADLKIETLPRRADRDWPALAHLERDLFKSPHDLAPIDRVERIEILACPRQLGEVQTIARRIKQLILTEGVAPGDIAVVYRSLSEVAPLVREVFDEFGLPYALESNPTLDTAPMVKALAAFLRLEADDWPFRQVLAVLSNNYFQPELPEWDDVQSRIAVERLVRALQLPSGRLELLEHCERWSAMERRDSQATGSDSTRQRAQDARRARPLLHWLCNTFDALPRKATQTQWGVALAEFARRTGILRLLDDADDRSASTRMDRIAWERLQKAFAAGDRLAQWLGEKPPTLDRDEALKLMLDTLRWESLPREHDEAGRVRVLSAPSARGIRIPYLFFAGLTEKALPPADRDDRIYSEGDYANFNEQGLSLADRRARSQGEMLLFYEILTRPAERLYLSYPALDEAAQPLSPSSYLLEVERSCGLGKIPRDEDHDLSPVPRRDAAPLGPSDLRIRAVDELLHGETRLLAGLLQAEPAPGLAAHLAAALHVAYDRQRGDSFGPYEGILTSRAAAKKLAAEFAPDHLWSPSRLEQYAHCPFQFFMERVLQIEPVAELALEIDYLKRGQLLHDALSTVHRRLNDHDGRPRSPADDEHENFLRQFLQVLGKLIAQHQRGGDLESAQREIDRRKLSQWGELYHEQHRKYDENWSGYEAPLRPTHFEVRFGPSTSARQDDDDAISTDEPYRLDLGDEQILITGRIDRIDVGQLAGQTVFNILDYKSGSPSTLKLSDVEAGTVLQLPLYVMAAEQLLLADREAVPWRTAYWFVREEGYSDRRALAISELQAGQLVPSESWRKLQETLRERVRAIVGGIRRAEFPMFSGDDECTRHCAYRTVCRVNQTRALEKIWPPQPAEPQ